MIINNVYSFDTYAPVVLRKSYTNMVLHGILSYSKALTYEPNLPSMHVTVTAFSNGAVTMDQLVSSNYLLFRSGLNEELVFSESWLVPSSITTTSVSSAIITVTDPDLTSALALLDNAGVQYSIQR